MNNKNSFLISALPMSRSCYHDKNGNIIEDVLEIVHLMICKLFTNTKYLKMIHVVYLKKLILSFFYYENR